VREKEGPGATGDFSTGIFDEEENEPNADEY
jgi:hypothetical protein